MRALWLLALAGLFLAGCSDDGDSDDSPSGIPDGHCDDGHMDVHCPDGADSGGGNGGTDDGTDDVTDDGMGGPAPAPVELAVSATGLYPVNPAFDPTTLQVAAGALVKLTFTNADQNVLTDHNWVLEGVDGAISSDIGHQETDTVEFTAPEAGEYVYYCSIGNHRDLGMEGTLTVTE